MQNELVRWAQRRIDSDVVVSASDFANACGDDDYLADVVDSLKVGVALKLCVWHDGPCVPTLAESIQLRTT